MVFSNLKIGSRLALGFGVMVLLMLGIAYTGIHSISGSKDAIRSITQDVTRKSFERQNCR